MGTLPERFCPCPTSPHSTARLVNLMTFSRGRETQIYVARTLPLYLRSEDQGKFKYLSRLSKQMFPYILR